MKIYKQAILIGFLCVSLNVFSQQSNHLFEATVNVGNKQFASALSWNQQYGIGKSKRFKVGYGLRLSNYFGADQNYITAPAKYTSGKSSLAALFTENIEVNLDTLFVPRPQLNFLNAAVYLTYSFFDERLDVGMNIDVIGFSVGSKRKGTFVSDGRTGIADAKPTTFNLLLISDSDLGSLNSEWYLRFWFQKKWAVKAGYQFLFTEYTTDTKIQQLPNSNDTNDRFRNKSAMLMLGVTYAPFRK
ncbi:MAG: hypothetical protein H7Y04_01470 [Verrucomicrobia bacterium]|nr:hypothetical protein [Cytophagales bacterium]